MSLQTFHKGRGVSVWWRFCR